jgi:hypothetical protein
MMDVLIKNADQVGIVVADLDRFLQNMKDLLGIDDFEVVEYPPDDIKPETTYYDKPTEFKLRMAFRDFEKFQLEVIQPLEGKSVFKDYLEKNGPGLHHIRFTQKNFDEADKSLREKGIPCIASGRGAHGSSQWAYYDTSALLEGLFIEIRKIPS